MNLELDAQKLAEAREWQQRNFDRQLERIRSLLIHFLDVEIAEALRFVRYDRDDRMGVRTHSDAAALIAGNLTQAVSNCDLRGLVNAAGDLSVTISAQGALEALRADLPDEVREAWEQAERDAKDERDDKKDADQAARQAKRDAQCQGDVPLGGRMIGFRQCTNKGRGTIQVDGVEYRNCGRHKIFRPHLEEQRKLDTRTRS